MMKSITVSDLQEKMKVEKSVYIIDVREDYEVAKGKIPEAQHIPLGEIPNTLEKLDKNKPFYVICQAGGRSSRACEFLSNQGYDVTNVTGGMFAWQGEVK